MDKGSSLEEYIRTIRLANASLRKKIVIVKRSLAKEKDPEKLRNALFDILEALEYACETADSSARMLEGLANYNSLLIQRLKKEGIEPPKWKGLGPLFHPV
ncbi:MAG: hypothetical protein QW220_01125 [Candidatus Bathyarchaeia archaeon]